MRLYDLFENDPDDFDWDDEPQKKPTPPEVLKHLAKKDRNAWRVKQQRRYDREQNSDSRHIPKSAMEYKPFKIPLIRFGKFGQRSRIGFDSEFRNDALGNATHEAGVSCYQAMPHQDGYLIIEPEAFRSVNYSSDVMSPILNNYKEQIIRYVDNKIPMDLFLIHGHLVSFGTNKEWVSVGSDGELLLDTAKPYQAKSISPEKVYLGRVNLIQWFDAKFNLDKIRQELSNND